jgi:hypothetical protein
MGALPPIFDPTGIDRSDQKLEQCNDPFKVCGAVPITVEVVALSAATSPHAKLPRHPGSPLGAFAFLGSIPSSRVARGCVRFLHWCGRFGPNAARHRVLRRPGLGPTECAAAGALDVGARDPCRPQCLSISAILHVVGRALLSANLRATAFLVPTSSYPAIGLATSRSSASTRAALQGHGFARAASKLAI